MAIGHISTNTLLAEGDVAVQRLYVGDGQFQPTPSSRRVTFPQIQHPVGVQISTNTLLAEGDEDNAKQRVDDLAFQPTPSSRRVTLALRGIMCHT